MPVIFLLVIMPFLNRASGSDLFGYLPRGKGFVRPIYYTSAAFFLLLGLMGVELITALILTISFLIWRLPAWGRWFDLGRLEDGHGRPAGYSKFENILHKIAFKNDYFAFFLRNFIFLTPLYFLHIGFLILPFFIVLSYHLAWVLYKKNPIPLAEYLTGFWWAFLALATL